MFLFRYKINVCVFTLMYYVSTFAIGFSTKTLYCLFPMSAGSCPLAVSRPPERKPSPLHCLCCLGVLPKLIVPPDFCQILMTLLGGGSVVKWHTCLLSNISFHLLLFVAVFWSTLEEVLLCFKGCF